MKLPIYQIDAFTAKQFGGNPAAVVPLAEWLPVETMQAVAMENQLSETAFFVAEDERFGLRWFTPTTEVNLCGHATLATAHVLFAEMGYEEEKIEFSSQSGILEVIRSDQGYEINFPDDIPVPDETCREAVEQALGSRVVKVLKGREDIVAILEDVETVRSLHPDFRLIAEIETRGILATARGENCDFVSRCFFPRFGIDEDPVTGSAHTTLAPYWSQQIGKSVLSAQQISRRSGDLVCSVCRDRVSLFGEAVTFLRGEIELSDS